MQMQNEIQMQAEQKFCKYAEAVKADGDKQRLRYRYSNYRYRYRYRCTALRYALIELTANELTH